MQMKIGELLKLFSLILEGTLRYKHLRYPEFTYVIVKLTALTLLIFELSSLGKIYIVFP